VYHKSKYQKLVFGFALYSQVLISHVRVLNTIVYAGGGFRTRDLQIMSIAFFGRPVRFYQANWHSNQAELPRHSLFLIIWEIK